RHVAIRFRSREKLAVTFLDEHVEDRLFKCGIGRVTVCLPAAVVHIEFDAAADRISVIYPNCGIAKIRSRLAIPGPELDNIDLVTGNADKMFAEIHRRTSVLAAPAHLGCVTGKRALVRECAWSRATRRSDLRESSRADYEKSIRECHAVGQAGKLCAARFNDATPLARCVIPR